MTERPQHTLHPLLQARYGDAPAETALTKGSDTLVGMAGRGSCRSFADTPVSLTDLEMLSAVALASPTKSDLQQRDIVLVTDPTLRDRLAALVGDQDWVAGAPVLAVFCGNNRRQRLLHEWNAVPFANDHLDAFFNAAVDSGIALAAFVTAAEAVGLGCCPISAMRNEAQAVSDLLNLPDHVFPVAGLAVGYPARPPRVSMRLPLQVTVHHNGYDETGLQKAVDTYCQLRAQAQPFGRQRLTDRFGTSDSYGWADDKVRQYSQPERADFGAFVRKKGFQLR